MCKFFEGCKIDKQNDRQTERNMEDMKDRIGQDEMIDKQINRLKDRQIDTQKYRGMADIKAKRWIGQARLCLD